MLHTPPAHRGNRQSMACAERLMPGHMKATVMHEPCTKNVRACDGASPAHGTKLLMPPPPTVQLCSCRGAGRRGWREKTHMALGVARGMQALEEADPPILHRDLKPSNVLLDARAPSFNRL